MTGLFRRRRTLLPTYGSVALAGWVGLAPCPAPAEEPSTAGAPESKGRYTLFNPVPRERMRPLTTDRPDKTESPYTVDAGHFQVEMDLVTYAHDRAEATGGDTITDAFAIAPANLKVGLLNNVDLQFVLETYNSVRIDDRAAGAITRMSGYGNTLVRLKVNIWGNDDGATALGIMPFVKFPTSQDGLGNNSVEGGVIVPLAIHLPGDWDLGLMTEFDFDRSDDGDGHETTFVNSITLGHDVYGKLGSYAEFYSAISTEDGSRWIGTVDVGLTLALTDDLRLDGGINIGITDAADDLNPFAGLSWRF